MCLCQDFHEFRSSSVTSITSVQSMLTTQIHYCNKAHQDPQLSLLGWVPFPLCPWKNRRLQKYSPYILKPKTTHFETSLRAVKVQKLPQTKLLHLYFCVHSSLAFLLPSWLESCMTVPKPPREAQHTVNAVTMHGMDAAARGHERGIPSPRGHRRVPAASPDSGEPTHRGPWCCSTQTPDWGRSERRAGFTGSLHPRLPKGPRSTRDITQHPGPGPGPTARSGPEGPQGRGRS